MKQHCENLPNRSIPFAVLYFPRFPRAEIGLGSVLEPIGATP
jgi:hypothetical protein